METEKTTNATGTKRDILGVEYLTQKDVAEMLGKTRQTIGRWIAKGELTATRLGRDWLIRPESIKEYLNEKTQIGVANRTPKARKARRGKDPHQAQATNGAFLGAIING